MFKTYALTLGARLYQTHKLLLVLVGKFKILRKKPQTTQLHAHWLLHVTSDK